MLQPIHVNRCDERPEHSQLVHLLAVYHQTLVVCAYCRAEHGEKECPVCGREAGREVTR